MEDAKYELGVAGSTVGFGYGDVCSRVELKYVSEEEVGCSKAGLENGDEKQGAVMEEEKYEVTAGSSTLLSS